MFKPCFGYHAIMLCKDSTCVRCPDLYECCTSSNNRKLAEYQRALEKCAKSPNAQNLQTILRPLNGI